MAARKTRQKIKDHVDSAINHTASAAEQLAIAMEMGEERSPVCNLYIPKAIEMMIACRELIENIRAMM